MNGRHNRPRMSTEMVRHVIFLSTDPPEVTITIQPRIVMEGSELVLNCDINSNPRATILPWKFIGKYDKPENQTWSAKDTELRIENILYTDAGTYICTARNEYGQSDGQIRVDVHCKYPCFYVHPTGGWTYYFYFFRRPPSGVPLGFQTF